MEHHIPDCAECHKSFICFMVNDSVWQAAGFTGYDGESARICMSCFEGHLGRKLTLEDFPVPYKVYCNTYWHIFGLKEAK